MTAYDMVMEEHIDGILNVIRGVLEREGVDEPEAGIHSWRCRYPDRYDKCNCLDLVMDEIRVQLTGQTASDGLQDG